MSNNNDSLRIGVYVPQAWVAQGRKRNASGHVQVAMRSAEEVRHIGHHVEIITHECPEGHEASVYMPSDVTVHTIPDAFDRPRTDTHVDAGQPSINPRNLLRQVVALRRLARQLRLDVLHLHGRWGTVRLAAILAATRPRCTVVVTTIGEPPEKPAAFERRLVKKIDSITIAAPSILDRCAQLGISAQLVRHGVVRDLDTELEPSRSESTERASVLFWREANDQNGGDLALKAFDELAPTHPDVDFVMAIRPYWHETPGVDELADKHDNVIVHRFPYPHGVTIAGLIADAAVIVLPFRSQTMHPQMTVLESAAMGKAVVTTAIGSNIDIIRDGIEGRLIPPGDADALREATGDLLDRPDVRSRLGRQAAEAVRERWSWDDHGPTLDHIYRGKRSVG